jgi:hypothetical protein
MRKRTAGSALIELALSLTLLVPLFIAVFDFGMGLLVYRELVDAVSAGARYASLRAYDAAGETPSPAYLAAVRNMTVYGDPDRRLAPLVGGLRPEDIQVRVRFERRVPVSVTVAVDGHGPHLPFRLLRIAPKPALTLPYAGVFQPGG